MLRQTLLFALIVLPIGVFAQSNTASIDFDTTFHDFGDIHQGEVAEHVFTFTNTGKVPVKISHIATTCGCTAPEWPKKPIPPNQSEEIVVRFDSSGKSGIQQKGITLFSNVEHGRIQLKIRANVLPQKNR